MLCWLWDVCNIKGAPRCAAMSFLSIFSENFPENFHQTKLLIKFFIHLLKQEKISCNTWIFSPGFSRVFNNKRGWNWGRENLNEVQLAPLWAFIELRVQSWTTFPYVKLLDCITKSCLMEYEINTATQYVSISSCYNTSGGNWRQPVKVQRVLRAEIIVAKRKKPWREPTSVDVFTMKSLHSIDWIVNSNRSKNYTNEYKVAAACTREWRKIEGCCTRDCPSDQKRCDCIICSQNIDANIYLA